VDRLQGKPVLREEIRHQRAQLAIIVDQKNLSRGSRHMLSFIPQFSSFQASLQNLRISGRGFVVNW
jgi:hypothetical protein